MNFWSDVEKEYNELSGESQTRKDDSKSSSPEINELISDIKKDIEKIPRADLFPPAKLDEEEELHDEESDSDQEEGKRSLNSKSVKDKRCVVNGKTYEIGERWKDEKTGKNMMCILMNVPKDIQPLLSDVDDVLSSNSTPEWKRPSVEPQWSYTATPKRKACQEPTSGKSTEKEKRPSKDENKANEEEKKPEEVVDLSSTDNLNDIEKENQEKQPKEETETTEKIPEIIVVDPPEDKLTKKGEEGDGNEKEDAEDESDRETELEDKNVLIDKNDKQGNNVKTNEVEEESDEDSNDEMENNDERQKNTKDDKKDIEPEEVDMKSNEHSTTSNKVENEDLSKETSGSEGTQSNSSQEKGQPIYTKETVVVQRKLIKTEQTIETTETDKTNK